MNPRSGSMSILLVGCVLSLSTTLTVGAGPGKKDGDDSKLIQGTWTVVELHQVNSKPTEDEKAFLKSGGYKITITANKLIHSPDKSDGEYRLDQAKTPKVME